MVKITQQKIFWTFRITESLVTHKHKRESRALTDVEQPPADNIRQTGNEEELWRHVGAKAVVVNDVNISSSKSTCRAVVSGRRRRRTHSPWRPISAHRVYTVYLSTWWSSIISWYNHISNNAGRKHVRRARGFLIQFPTKVGNSHLFTWCRLHVTYADFSHTSTGRQEVIWMKH